MCSFFLFCFRNPIWTATQASKSDQPSKSVIFLRLYQPNLELFSDSEIVSNIYLYLNNHSRVQGNYQNNDNNIEYARLFDKNPLFEKLTSDGVKYSSKEHYTFKLSDIYLNDIKNISLQFKFDVKDKGLYSASLPALEYSTSGFLNASILDSSLLPKGMLHVEYLLVKPLPTTTFSGLEKRSNSSGIQWAGHRGIGQGLRTDLTPNLYENTLDAYNYVCRHGARMVELDVQLTKDMIPIVYHDFVRPISAQSKFLESTKLSLPVKDFTQIEHESMRIPGLESNFSVFETFESILKNLEPGCGINIEVKYPQAYEDLSMEASLPVDINLYIDIILQVLFQNADDRPVIFSSFSADICALLQQKQQRFDVYLLTSGDLESFKVKPWGVYWDLRTRTVSANIAFSKSLNLKGLSLYAEHLYQISMSDIERIHEAGLHVAVWGDSVNTRCKALDLLKRGVDLLILDNVDLLNKNSTN